MPAPFHTSQYAQDLEDEDDDELYPDEIAEALRAADRYMRTHIPATAQTRSCRAYLKTCSPAEITQKCRDILKFMNRAGMDLTCFLHAISWTMKETTRDPVIRYARTALMFSEELPVILQNWYCPPRAHDQGIRTAAAGEILDNWAMDLIKRKINREMRAVGPMMLCPQENLTEEALLDIKLAKLVPQAKKLAPTFWLLCRAAAYTPRQELMNTMKDPDTGIFMMLAMASFSRSHHRNKIQKLNAIYFKSCGLTAKAFDSLHAMLISMSQKWVYDGVDRLGEAANTNLQEDVKKYAVRGSHDNLNVQFTKRDQRLDNNSHFDSGTAATIYVIKDPNVREPDNRAYQERFRLGSRNPITLGDIYALEAASAPRIRQQEIHQILRFLLDSKSFKFSTYRHKASPLLKPPPPVIQLPTGPKHVTTQYMLGTAHIEEASYEGNERCIAEWFHQMGLDSAEDQKTLGINRLMVWIGDQLTTSRIRGIKRFRSQDLNATERFEHLLEIFGWFHAQINEGHSLHSQYYGTGKGASLKRDFYMLKRKGLTTPSVQGPFHENLRQGLAHVAAARFRDVWRIVGGVEDLAELRQQTPEQLHALAEQIWNQYSSSRALAQLRTEPAKSRNNIFIQAVQFNRDILNFLNLDEAMRTGDVGRMKDLLPRLLFRFAGGGNSNYTTEILETIQAFEREWPEDLQAFILKYCWLANTTGKPGLFEAFDMLQEHNIRDIKFIFMVFGPLATWEYIKRISPAIPILRNVKNHFEEEINHFRRGKSHSSVDAENDIARLQAMYAEDQIHVKKPSRRAEYDEIEDFIGKGSSPEVLGRVIRNWKNKRVVTRATTEDWEFEGDKQALSV